jgi:hypothetical protein
MLIAENAGPRHPKFVNQDEAREAMQWMVIVLRNRLKLGAQHFSAGRETATLRGLITAPNQVEGFRDYPTIARQPLVTINGMVDIANDGTHLNHAMYRTYLRSVLTVAAGRDVGVDPCPSGLYAWRTQDDASPGRNFAKFTTKGGQDFYTLTVDFLSLVSCNGRVK